jgi:tetratricopeptide (TPR) repeat protein
MLNSGLFNAPPMVTQNISRSRGYLRRNDVLRALETLSIAAEMFDPKKIVGKSRYETEIHLTECVDELNKHPTISNFLKTLSKGATPSIVYVSGEEAKLASTLHVIYKVLKDQEDEISMIAGDSSEMRRESLWEKGTACLDAGQTPKGKSILRRMGEEFGDEEGVLTRIGEALVNSKCLFEAAEILEQALEKFSKDNKAYSLLIKCYTELQEYEKAEVMYIKALKQFGQHPVTVLNFAKMYRLWNKRDKAFEMAKTAKRLDPSNEEAQELLDWSEGKKK